MIHKKIHRKIGGFFIETLQRKQWELLGCLGSGLLATAAALLSGLAVALAVAIAVALAVVLLAELALEELGEQEIASYSGGGYTDHDTDDNEGGILLLFLLVEAEHSEHPP